MSYNLYPPNHQAAKTNRFGSLKRQSRWLSLATWQQAFNTLSLNYKAAVAGLMIIGVFSLLAWAWQINQSLMVEVAVPGGQLTEGVIGAPQFINPLLATSGVDQDLTALIYSGLMRLDQSGQLVPDLAETVEISEDGRQYTFVLKEGLTWHDGQPITVADIEFTIDRAKDPRVQSPRRINWEGVSIDTEGSRTITFTLSQPFALFLHNTTLGILPRHIWRHIPPEAFLFNDHNIRPVGSGPYKLKTIGRSDQGTPKDYTLEAFDNFALGRPLINQVQFRFYATKPEIFAAWQQGRLDSWGAINPQLIDQLDLSDANLVSAPLPRIFAAFFNQNQASVFTHRAVREALNVALDKDLIIEQVLAGFGDVLNGPLPTTGPIEVSQATKDIETDIEVTLDDHQALAKDILTADGWRLGDDNVWAKGDDRLTFTITTAKVPELVQIAELIANQWQNLGAEVSVQTLDQSELHHQVIRPRRFEVLLFGLMMGQGQDLFSYWHSSQRQDPGVNIAMYANISADSRLRDLRATQDQDARLELKAEVTEIITGDWPAAWIYTPHFLYAVPTKILNFTWPPLTLGKDRFATIYQWHIKTETIWKIFARPEHQIN